MFKIKLAKVLAIFAASTIGDAAAWANQHEAQVNLTFGYDAFENIGGKKLLDAWEVRFMYHNEHRNLA